MRVDHLQQDIAALESVRESLATPDDQRAPVKIALWGSPASGKTTYLSSLSSALRTRARERDLLPAGSTISINIEAAEAATLPGGITPTAAGLVVISQAAHRPPTAVLTPYRPVHHWLRLAELDLYGFPLPPPAQPKPVIGAGLMAQPASLAPVDSFIRAVAWLAARSADEPAPITLFVRLDRLRQLRDGLLQLIHGTLTALRFALILVLVALARRPQVRNFVLILVATSRHYGHRSEPDDCILPAHRWMSIIGGEPVLSC